MCRTHEYTPVNGITYFPSGCLTEWMYYCLGKVLSSCYPWMCVCSVKDCNNNKH